MQKRSICSCDYSVTHGGCYQCKRIIVWSKIQYNLLMLFSILGRPQASISDVAWQNDWLIDWQTSWVQLHSLLTWYYTQIVRKISYLTHSLPFYNQFCSNGHSVLNAGCILLHCIQYYQVELTSRCVWLVFLVSKLPGSSSSAYVDKLH